MSSFENTEEQAVETTRVLLFRVENEWYGVFASHIVEVVAAQATTRVPGSPAHMTGVFNLRGRIVPSIDLRVALDIGKATTASAQSAIIVLEPEEARGRAIGIFADEVFSVATVPTSGLRHLPASAGTSGKLSAVFDFEGRTVFVLDVSWIHRREVA